VAGEVYDDPSEDALYMFLQDLRSPDQRVRVDRLEEEREGEWAQVTLTPHGLYEFTSNDSVRNVSSLATIHEFLTKWAFDLWDD
jgi:hypothetical protein